MGAGPANLLVQQTEGPEPALNSADERRLARRQLAFTLLVLCSVGALDWQMLAFLKLNGLAPLKACILILFIVLVVPIALSFWTAVIGFIIRLRGGDPLEVTRQSANEPAPASLPLTAIVLPVYNEDPARVMAGLKATYQSLERTGQLDHFEFFLLSDTTDPDVWVREELAFVETRRQVSEPQRIFYRNRRQNTDRKTGNIAEFCTGWGGRYEYMIVFDADSLMTGSSLVQLVRLMQANPRLGLLQAPPLPINRVSLFGRIHQFAMNAYSPVFLSGLNFWQGTTGNYWGHNAIIRIRPFIEHCRLPTLPGRAPLGGSILSHDFIEAAFMRRAGWEVRLASELRGSYEEMPSSLLTYAARDRRWCQGNLQHTKLLLAPGFRFISRLHLAMGILAYLASPLWLLMLALTTIQGISESLSPHRYFGHGHSLFPNWPADIVRPGLCLFGVVLGILLLPKLLSVLLEFTDRAQRRSHGGGARLGLSALLEIMLSTLLAPNLAWLQSGFVLRILLGKTTGWQVQERGDLGTSWGQAFRRQWFSATVALAWACLLAATVPALLVWFSPVLLGLLLGIPLSVWTSKPGAGLWARDHGLFLIPEESAPPQIVRDFRAALAFNAGRPWCKPGDPLAQVLADAEVRELHLAMLPMSPADDDLLTVHHRQGLVLKCLQQGPAALTLQEKRELLLHADAITALYPAA